MTLALRPVLSSDLVLYLAAQCRRSARQSRCTFLLLHLSVCGPFVTPPPCSFWVHGFLVLGETHSMVRRGLFVFVLTEDVQNVLQSYQWTPPPTVSPSRCMTFKQGEKLILSSHLQVCRANSSVPPTAEEKGCRKLVKIPFAGGGILIFHPACPHRPVHDGSAHWRPPVLLHVSECCELIRAGPGSLIQNTFKAARSYSAPVSLELTVIFQTSTSSRAL